MKRTLLAIVAIAACTPDVTKNPPPPPMVTAEFDPGASPPVVPAPNDLAFDPTSGKIVVPPSPTDTPAQHEFNQSYLGSLSGFPFETPAQAVFSQDLAPASVNPTSVLAVDLSNGGAPVSIAPTFVPGVHAVVIPPPQGGWTRAHHYAIAIQGGEGGVRGANGEPVVASPTFALVSSPASLVTCTDLTSPSCAPAIDIIPSTVVDPKARLADQTQKAIALEKLRQGLAPVFAALGARGVDKNLVVLLWTFTIVDAAEVTFDPASSVVPFPNDALRPNGKVALPNPKTGAPLAQADCAAPTDAQIQLTCGLNTLDGFSTIAPPISESSDTLGALEQGSLGDKPLPTGTVGLVPVSPVTPGVLRTAPKFTGCVGCASTPLPAGAPVPPEQLQWRLDAPLDEKTTYLGYVTTDLPDQTGKPVIPTPTFALLRSASPLVAGGHSTVTVLTDAQAAQLEPLRAALAPALDGLQQAGIPRTKLALAFGFTTQSEASLLPALAAVPALPAIAAGAPAALRTLVDVTAQLGGAGAAAGIPLDAVGKILAGEFLTPLALTGPGGTLDPTHPQIEPVEIVVTIPNGPAPPGGFPIVIFGHGFTRSRLDVLPIANVLAKTGHIAIASDVVFHGDRTTCTGSKAATGQPSDDAACADPTTQKCDENPIAGHCVLRTGGGPGDFARDALGRPLISGWNIINLTNLFATRDNFRQQVIDLSQLVRVLRGSGASAIGTTAGVTVDATKLGYVGQSLGGILGALWTAATPDATNVVLNVAGGALPQIILTAPSFAAQRDALLATLAGQGIQPGTPAFDRFIGAAQWILDPADPANVGWLLTHGTNVNRRVLLQFIEGDQTVPNVSNLALVAAANRDFTPTPPSFGCTSPLFCYEFTEQGDGFDQTTAAPASRHGFLLAPPPGTAGPALTAKAQTQVATFLTTGGLP